MMSVHTITIRFDEDQPRYYAGMKLLGGAVQTVRFNDALLELEKNEDELEELRAENRYLRTEEEAMKAAIAALKCEVKRLEAERDRFRADNVRLRQTTCNQDASNQAMRDAMNSMLDILHEALEIEGDR